MHTYGGAVQLEVSLPHGECFLVLGFELQPVEVCFPHNRMLRRLNLVLQKLDLSDRFGSTTSMRQNNLQTCALAPARRRALIVAGAGASDKQRTPPGGGGVASYHAPRLPICASCSSACACIHAQHWHTRYAYK